MFVILRLMQFQGFYHFLQFRYLLQQHRVTFRTLILEAAAHERYARRFHSQFGSVRKIAILDADQNMRNMQRMGRRIQMVSQRRDRSPSCGEPSLPVSKLP